MDIWLQNWAAYWPAAVLMIVAASWALYHFVAPQSWREWSGAGLVQAFIIALYAEMYGFPADHLHTDEFSTDRDPHRPL